MYIGKMIISGSSHAQEKACEEEANYHGLELVDTSSEQSSKHKRNKKRKASRKFPDAVALIRKKDSSAVNHIQIFFTSSAFTLNLINQNLFNFLLSRWEGAILLFRNPFRYVNWATFELKKTWRSPSEFQVKHIFRNWPILGTNLHFFNSWPETFA